MFTSGYAAFALATCAGVNRVCTEQCPFQRMILLASSASAECPPSGRNGFHTSISSSG